MHRSRGYLQYFTILLVLSLHLIEEVSSKKCYACDSNFLSDCISKAKQSKFELDCSLGRSMFNITLNNQDIRETKPLDTDCLYVKGISIATGKERVIRTCMMKAVKCYTLKYAAAGNGYQVDSCERCDSDLCNSSGHLSTGIWSLSLSLLALYFFKF